MKKTILFLMLLMIPLVISSAEATIPINLGTVPYKGNSLIMINQSHDVTLNLLYESVPNGLRLNKLGFNSLMNQTAYSFYSNTLVFDWRFIPNTKAFYYQDATTDQVYYFTIDYSNATIPVSPWEQNYTQLLLKFNNSQIMLSRANNSLTNLSVLVNTTIATLNTSLTSMTLNNTINENKLVNMSFNVSLADTTIHSLYREKESLSNNLFVTQIIMGLLIPFCVIFSLYLAKRYGLLNTDPGKDRLRKQFGIGYGKLQKWHDDRIVQKNDEITKKRGGYNHIDDDGKVRQIAEEDRRLRQISKEIKYEQSEKTQTHAEQPSYSRMVETIDSKDFLKKERKVENEEVSMLSQGQIIKKLCEEGATAKEIIDTTGFDSQYVNALCKRYEERKK